MRPFLVLLGVLSALSACAPDERTPDGAASRVSEGACEAYEEARRLSVEAPAQARIELEDAITREAPGTLCRRRMAALLEVLRGHEARADLARAPFEEEDVELDEASEPEASFEPALAAHLLPERFSSARAEGPKKKVVVLDPGHGGNEYGATSEGYRESRLTLDIAERAVRILAARRPDIEVRLTRSEDQRVSLEQRTSMANAIDADVFVSIHLNDAGEAGGLVRGGVTTFVLDITKDEQAARLAARENGTSVEEVSEISVFLAGLERKAQLEGSRRLAARVHAETLRGAREHLPRIADRGIKPALFRVLVGAKMPAILLEASFMNIPGEREAIRTVRYRESIARGVAQGILTYFFEEA